MTKQIKKEFLDYADEESEAFEKAELFWAQGDKNITVAKVNQMIDPPKTVHKYVILRVTEL